MIEPARGVESQPKARVACLVTPDRERHGYLSVIWSQGPDMFLPLSFDSQRVGMLRDATRAVRERLEELVRIYTDALQAAENGDVPDVRRASFELAKAGYELRTQLFHAALGPGAEAQTIATWLNGLCEQNRVESLEIIADDSTPNIPWNLVYETEPDERAFLGGTERDELWRPFWGLRYNLAGGQRVDPRRRLALPAVPTVLLVIDPSVLDELRKGPDREMQTRVEALERLRGRPGVEWITSREQLQERLRRGRPDLLYWLGHAIEETGWLALGEDEVKPTDLRRWLEGDGTRPPGGVVFLNACRTADVTSGDDSFLDSVLKSRMGGVIATENVVPLSFANAVGLDFLEAFLVGGRSIGAILSDLRKRVPLGLLYGTYCPPELQTQPQPAPSGSERVPASAHALAIAPTGSTPKDLPERPYPALNYYTRDDRALFAGRDADVVRFAHILDAAATRVLILHGESGSGKSSFLRAGVVPYLEDVCIGYRFASDRSRTAGERSTEKKDADPVLFVRATDDLIGQVADALATFAANPPLLRRPSGAEEPAKLHEALSAVTNGKTDAAGVRDALVADPGVLGRVLAAFAVRLSFRLVLVIDQAEEVFTLGDTRDRERPARVLAPIREAAVADGEFKIIVSLRTEYYGRLVDQLRSGVRAAVGTRDYLLTDLNETALAEAIRRPTEDRVIPYANTAPFAQYGFRYAEGFVEKLCEDLLAHTGRQDSVLPLAQVICGQLFDRVKDRASTAKVIGEDDLNAIGGVEGGMKRHAEELVAKLFSARKDQQAFRRLMASLYRRQPDGTLTTDLVPEEKLTKRWARWTGQEQFGPVLEKVADGGQRLLRTTPRRIGRESRTDVSLGHDSLARVAQTWEDEFERWRRRRKLVSGLIVSLLLVLGTTTATVWFYDLWQQAEQDRKDAAKARDEAGKALKGEANARKDEEKARKHTQEALARSFLHAIGQRWNDPALNQIEVDALWQLAGLDGNDESVRLMVLQDALTSPLRLTQMTGKLTFLTQAAVGLDRKRRDRVGREIIMPILKDELAPFEARLHAAQVGVFLGLSDPEFVPLALTVAVEGVRQGEVGPSNLHVNFLSDLLDSARDGKAVNHEDATRVEQLRRELLAARANQIIKGRKNPIIVRSDSFLVLDREIWDWTGSEARDLVATIHSADVADMAQPFVTYLAQKLDVPAYTALSVSVQSLAGQLDPNDRLAAVLAQLFVTHLADNKSEPTNSTLARAVGVLAGRLDPNDAAPLAQQLVNRLADEKGTYAIDHLSNAMQALAGRLAPKVAAPLAQKLVERMIAEEYSHNCWTLSSRVAMLAGRLDSEDAAPLVEKLLNHMANDSTNFVALARVLTALVGRLDTRDATRPAQRLVDQLAKMDRRVLEAQFSTLAVLAKRLAPACTALFAQRAFDYLALGCERNRQELARGATALAGRVDPKVAAPLAQKLADYLVIETDGETRRVLSKTVIALAGRVDPKVAAPLAQNLIDRTDKEKDASTIGDLSAAAAALAGRLAPEVAAPLVTPLVQKLVARTASEKEDYALWDLAVAVAALAGQLDSKVATQLITPLAQRLVARLADERCDTRLAGGAAALAKLLDPQDVPPLAQKLIDRLAQALSLAGEDDREKSQALSECVSALAGCVNLKEAAVFYAKLLNPRNQTVNEIVRGDRRHWLPQRPHGSGRPWVTSLPPAAARHWIDQLLRGPLAGLVDALGDDREWWLAGLSQLPLDDELASCVDLLKAPTCVGVFREALLKKVGRVAGREFRTVWDFEAWVQQHRPDLDFTTPPRRDP